MPGTFAGFLGILITSHGYHTAQGFGESQSENRQRPHTFATIRLQPVASMLLYGYSLSRCAPYILDTLVVL